MFFHHLPFANPIMLLLSLPVLIYSGRDYYVNTIRQFKTKHLGMDSLVGVSTSFAFIYSLFVTLFEDLLQTYHFPNHTYFESAVVIITFLLIGKYIEERAKSKTNTSVKKLLGMQSNTANLVENRTNFTTKEVPIQSIKVGDLLLIKAGEKIPVDGVIFKGEGYIDESSMSGEPLPKFKRVNDTVIAGTVNQDNTLYITSQKVGADTLLSQIINQVRKAQASKAPIQRIVDKVTNIFVPVVFIIALLTLFTWLLIAFFYSDTTFMFEKNILNAVSSFITVLVISCPCALGLATPTAIVVGLGKATNIGMLIKDAENLEVASKITDIVIDKTGTITEGKPQVTNLVWANKLSLNKHLALNLAYFIENKSTHPIAKSVVNYLLTHKEDGYKPEDEKISSQIANVQNVPGFGLETEFTITSHKERVFVGSLKYYYKILQELNLNITQDVNNEIIQEYEQQASLGNTCVILFKTIISPISTNQAENSPRAIEIVFLLTLEDKIRESTPDFIKQMANIGVGLHLLSGDNDKSVKNVSDKLGIKKYLGNLLPLDKSNYIKQLQSNNKIVAMVGDGINDSTSLATADLSIAMGSGTDIAIDVAKVTILNSNLRNLIKLVNLSKLTNRTIKQNLFWAFIYNITFIPVAAGLFVNQGLKIDPMIASILMSLSSISVVSNSILLKYKKV